MKRILITGGFGFVGGRLSKKLSGDYSVIASSRKNIEASTLQAHGDVQQISHQCLLSKNDFPQKIDTVIHLAALNEWDSVQYPSEAIRVNVDESRIILENSIASGASQFIFFSTAHVYGSPLQGSINEDKLPVPVHPYAITHKAAEDYVIAASLQKKIQSIVVRLSNSFGAPITANVNRWTLLANDLCRQAIEKEKLSLSSNGCQYRDFICLTDVENVVTDMINRGSNAFKKNIYNLGSGLPMRVIDMANMTANVYEKIFGKKIAVQLPDGSKPSEEPAFQYNIDRLLAEGSVIRNEFEKELGQLILFCAQNFKRIG